MTLRGDAVHDNSGEGNFCDEDSIWKSSLGRHDSDRLLKRLNANHATAKAIADIRSEVHENPEDYRPDVERDYEFTLNSLHEKVREACSCAVSFAGGLPNHICRNPLVCAFCADLRAHTIYQHYLRSTFAHLDVAPQMNFLVGVIKPYQGVEADELPLVIQTLCATRRYIRNNVVKNFDYWKVRRGTDYARENAVAQFDTFLHISVSGKFDLDNTRYFPHMHFILRKANHRSGVGDTLTKLESVCHNRFLEFSHDRTLRVRKKPTDYAKETPHDIAKYASYASIMLKPTLSGYHRAHAMLLLEKNTKQFTRMREAGDFQLPGRITTREPAQLVYAPGNCRNYFCYGSWKPSS